MPTQDIDGTQPKGKSDAVVEQHVYYMGRGCPPGELCLRILRGTILRRPIPEKVLNKKNPKARFVLLHRLHVARSTRPASQKR